MNPIYTTEDGIKEVINMVVDGMLFEPITRQEDLSVHNYLVMKLNRLGFNAGNIREIVEYVLKLPEKKRESEGEKVAKEYFGESAYSDLD